MKALCAVPFLLLAYPAFAGSFTPPEGCTLKMTVQSRGCNVANYFICTADNEGDQWRADFDQEGIYFQSKIDYETQWIESYEINPPVKQVLDPNPSDSANFSELLATGYDSFTVGLSKDNGQKSTVRGFDRLTGEEVVIDGVTLKRTEYEMTETADDGTILRQARGREFISADFRNFFSGQSEIMSQGEWLPLEGSPMTFDFAGDKGFGVTQPIFDCDAVLSLNDFGQVMQVEPYLDAPPLHLSYMAGRSDRLILAFSGVGDRNEPIPTPEAPRLTGWDGENHVLFISDGSRSWMNGAGLAQALVDGVQGLVERIKPARIIAFGNSMGGSMALVFATLFKLGAVLAIVPQYSVKDDIVPEEARWQHFRRNITQWPFPAVPSLKDNPAQIMILHGGENGEMPHARRFRAPEGVDHYIVPQYGHALAACLKRDGVLRPLLEGMITGDIPAARAAVQSAGGITFAEHWQNLHNARKERRQNAAI